MPTNGQQPKRILGPGVADGLGEIPNSLSWQPLVA
jgi:hypothetical protein